LNPQQSDEQAGKHEQRIAQLKKEHETRVAQIKHDHANEIARLKRDHESQIGSLTQHYEEELAQVKRETELKEHSISEVQNDTNTELVLLRANLEDLRNQLGFMQHEYSQLRLLLPAPKQSFWARTGRKKG
jgi:chromosome segregation ATPase